MDCETITFDCGDCVKFNQDTCPTQKQLKNNAISDQLDELCKANLKEKDDYNETDYDIRDILYLHLPEYCLDFEVDKTEYMMCPTGKQWVRKESR